jgi:sortase A
MRKKLKTIILLVIMFLIGFGIYMYPYFADVWNAYRNSLLVEEYKEATIVETEPHKEELKQADDYNRKLGQTTNQVVTDREREIDPEYESLLSFNGSGIMGYIEIPKIQIEVPIYHYSTDEILDKGIGHIHGSSLPVGGKGTHAVLTGHRGLPESKLFTDLDQIEENDRFYIHSLTRNLAYRVTKIQVVLPHEVSSLRINPKKDLVTLVTCTPYGVNSHRLLITGIRCKYDVETIEQENIEGKELVAKSKVNGKNSLVIGLVVFMSIILISIIFSKRRR